MPVQTRALVRKCSSRPQVGHRLPQGEIAGSLHLHMSLHALQRRVNGERDRDRVVQVAPCETILLDVILGMLAGDVAHEARQPTFHLDGIHLALHQADLVSHVEGHQGDRHAAIEHYLRGVRVHEDVEFCDGGWCLP